MKVLNIDIRRLSWFIIALFNIIRVDLNIYMVAGYL